MFCNQLMISKHDKLLTPFLCSGVELYIYTLISMQPLP